MADNFQKEDSVLTVPNPFQKRGDGPEFIGKLKGKRCRIFAHDGDEYEGVLVKYNKYELLFLEDETEVPIIVMKNFIAAIVPLEGNPFEKKPDDVKPSGKEG